MVNLVEIKAILDKKLSKKSNSKIVERVVLKSDDLKAKETEIINKVSEKAKTSKAIRVMFENALNKADKWKILDISYKGKPFINKDNEKQISKDDGIVFQNVAKGFVKKIVC